MREKEVYLLDEPTANLDPIMASYVRRMMSGIVKRKVFLYSSHNLYEARDLGNKVILINEGRLVAFANIDSLRPRQYSVAVKVLAEGADEEKRVKEVMKG